MVFHWNLTYSKYPQVSRSLLGILVDLNNIVVWMVAICALISNSSGPFINLLGIVPSAPITIGITVTFRFHVFFWGGGSLAKSRYLSLFSLSFNFTLWSTIQPFIFSFSVYLSLGLFIWPRLSNLFVSQNPKEVSAFHSPGFSTDFQFLQHPLSPGSQGQFRVHQLQLVLISSSSSTVFSALWQGPLVNYFPHRVVSSLILFLC